MQRRIALVLSVMAVASTGSVLCRAQTPVQTPAPSAPAPSPVAPAQTPSLLPYSQQPGTTQGSQPTVVQQPPAVAPAQPTAANPYTAMPLYGVPDEDKDHQAYSSTYIPLDSWIYSAMTRLYSLGYAGTEFLSMRPWTRLAVLHILQASEDDIRQSNDEEAQEIYTKVMQELRLEFPNNGVGGRGAIYGVESVYGRAMGIGGQTLRDSYHLGETINNDYGRPYEPGFNSLLGFSTLNEYGRFSLYVRGEYQHSPSGPGYSTPLAAYISQTIDGIPYSGGNLHNVSIPTGTVPGANPFRLQEATLSFNIGKTEFSGGKSDAWLGPAQGGSLAWSNNAEDIYSVRINRVEPLYIPLFSRFLGPIRYDFFYGSLKGHTAPNDDWVHSEIVSVAPTSNFQFSFQRTIVFGGHGHEPVTLHNFLKGFFDLNDTTTAEKEGRNDPGARFSDFSMSWRLPFLRKYVTFVADSIAHDDVTPPSAPRRASFRTGLYLAQIPGARKVDLRLEVADTDPITSRSTGGEFMYFEGVQQQAYTNQGVLFGDWIGREGKGGQAWLTYHLSASEMIQLEVLDKKNDKDFGPGAFNAKLGTYNALGGTTQNQLKISVVKRLMHDNIEVNGWYQFERWVAPAYLTGPQHDNVATVQITFFPGLKSTATK